MNPPYPLVGNGAPLTMECETLAALKPMISYKDMVIGGNVSPSPEEPIDLDDDDIELLGEDISVGLYDGSDLDSMQHDAIPLSAYTETNPPTDPFGPWVVVERRKRVSRSVNVKKHAVTESGWIPFKLVRGGLLISILIFADDLILFAKATSDQARLINEILEEFGDHSGHKVNRSKSQVFFSANTALGYSQTVSSFLGI
ncbi:hypothetical protein V6N11_084286 [Hibiscus sabdariffa]|uniref:Reverse transcriptase domain-containing protein n=1 Tax=Hibiscus sabdariffa TaxID=183260 RepID=A0ABR2QSZ0_9ROSI